MPGKGGFEVVSASARGFRFAVLASRFHTDLVEGLLAACLDALRERGASTEAVEIVRVPGAFELPLAAQCLAQRRQVPDAMIALGVLIRGETAHFELIAGECTRGLARISLNHCLPLSMGVLTVQSRPQAVARSERNSPHNRGRQAALAAVEMAALIRGLRE